MTESSRPGSEDLVERARELLPAFGGIVLQGFSSQCCCLGGGRCGCAFDRARCRCTFDRDSWCGLGVGIVKGYIRRIRNAGGFGRSRDRRGCFRNCGGG